MKEIKSYELRAKYLKFFEDKGHKIIPSASLIPENDPSVLFTTAGMHPLVPFGSETSGRQETLRRAEMCAYGRYRRSGRRNALHIL